MNAYDVSQFFKSRFGMLVVFGIALRLVLAFLLNFNNDVASWALVMENLLAGSGLYAVDGYCYTPLWGYFLGFWTGAEDFLLNISSFGEYFPGATVLEHSNTSQNAYFTNPVFNLMVKSFILIFDVLAAYLIYWLVDDITGDRKKAETACIVWFLCPVVFLVSAVNGMFDVIGAVLLLLSVIMVRRGRLIETGFFFALATILKLFPGFFLFPIAAYIWVKYRPTGDQVKSIVTAGQGALIAFALVFLPYVLTGHGPDSIQFLTSRVGGGGFGNQLPEFTKYLVIALYLLMLFVITYFCVRATRGNAVSTDKGFMTMLQLTGSIVLLFPSNQQYYLIMVPFVVIVFVLGARHLKKALAMLSLGTVTISVVQGSLLICLPFVQMFGLGDINTIAPSLGWFVNGTVPISKILSGIGLIFMWLGAVLSVYLVLRHGIKNGDLDCIPEKLADRIVKRGGSPARVRTEVAGSKGRHD